MHYGGGAFIIAYLCVLLLLGLPLMWMEWSFGRYGGIWGKHTLPGIYDAATRKPWAKYLGVLGLYIPFVILVYYLYIESWTLGYSMSVATNHFGGENTLAGMQQSFESYLGIGNGVFAVSLIAIIFLAITLIINFVVALQADRYALQRLTMVAMPIFFLLTVALVVRVFTLPGAEKGLDFLWKPDWTQLLAPVTLFGKQVTFLEPHIWLAAAGQVFFTLSLGLGTVLANASYLRKDDDVALSGLTAVSLNELGEVVLGASLAVPAAFAIFGVTGKILMATPTGPYDLGFLTIPLIFQQMNFGSIIGALWFVLLFFAGVCASISLLNPIIAFFTDEVGWSRQKAIWMLIAMTLLFLAPIVLFQKQGFLADIDFWAVNLLLLIGAGVEWAVFSGALGVRRGWEGITNGGLIRVPTIFKFILQYITPLVLLVILGNWAWQEGLDKLLMEGVKPELRPYLTGARASLGVLLLIMMLIIRAAWKRKAQEDVVEPPDIEVLLDEEVDHVS